MTIKYVILIISIFGLILNTYSFDKWQGMEMWLLVLITWFHFDNIYRIIMGQTNV